MDSPRIHRLLLLFLIGLCAPPGRSHAQADRTGSLGPCVIQLTSGRTLSADSIWRTLGERIEYEQHGNLHDLPLMRVRSIGHGDRTYRPMDGQLVADPATGPRHLPSPSNEPHYGPAPEQPRSSGSTRSGPVPDTTIDLRALARKDAAEAYRGAGDFFLGYLTMGTLFGPFLIASHEPRPRLRHNSNATLFARYPQYRDAYQETMHRKKKDHVYGGMTLGLYLLVVAIVRSDDEQPAAHTVSDPGTRSRPSAPTARTH